MKVFNKNKQTKTSFKTFSTKIKILTFDTCCKTTSVKNTKDNADNRVKIHTFALSKDLDFLKKVSQITGGTYNETNNVYDFKKQILSVSNDGKPFDMRELNNEIRPSKTNKIMTPMTQIIRQKTNQK